MSKLDREVKLAEYGNVVPDGYMYYQKQVTPREDLALPNAYFKWYDLYPADAEITPEQRAEAREFVAVEAQHLQFDNELGFVILHRAGPMLLLMLMTWRGTNEVWESAYSKEAAREQAYTINEGPRMHRATFCVWELGPVWHERHAWVRFLSSKRDVEAKQAYINDRFAGLV